MAVYNFALDLNTVPTHDVDAIYWYRSGLYCRIQISV